MRAYRWTTRIDSPYPLLEASEGRRFHAVTRERSDLCYKSKPLMPKFFRPLLAFLVLCFCASCATKSGEIIISVPDQRLALYSKGELARVYKISTSKFGLGSGPGTYKTPVGRLEVAKKIGKGAPLGAVFKSRQQTGEVLKPDAPGRDPIVTRILWLKGTSPSTKSSQKRFIYIHGTPEERTLGRPTSFGCVRMASKDVAELYDKVAVGSSVIITTQQLSVVERIRAANRKRADQGA